MIRSGGILGKLLVSLPYAAPNAGMQELIKTALELTKDPTRYSFNKGIKHLKNDFTLSEGSGITLTNNKIKDIIKVIKS